MAAGRPGKKICFVSTDAGDAGSHRLRLFPGGGIRVIDRRTFVVSGAAFGAAGAAWAGPSANSKSHAIDAIKLPADLIGVLAYRQGGKIHHLRCAGFADVEARKPVTAATQFKWGSASKWLTTVAVLRLVEQKRLDLDTPIATYLPDFRRDTGERVLLRHLLSNTSGTYRSAEPAD